MPLAPHSDVDTITDLFQQTNLKQVLMAAETKHQLITKTTSDLSDRFPAQVKRTEEVKHWPRQVKVKVQGY